MEPNVLLSWIKQSAEAGFSSPPVNCGKLVELAEVFQYPLGLACNEFGYDEHLAIRAVFFLSKRRTFLMDTNVKEVRLQ